MMPIDSIDIEEKIDIATKTKHSKTLYLFCETSHWVL